MARLSQSSQVSPPSKKRKSDTDDAPRQKKAKYAYLAPKTKHISQALIRSEWKSLPAPAQETVRAIFLTAKRTTLTQVTDGPRRREADFVVNDALRRLERQLPRMPFPKGTKVADLDLDGILEQVRTLEAEKTPLIDSIKLLEEEIEKEDRRVEMKRKELARLEKESKAAAKARRHRAAKTHPLLEDGSERTTSFDAAESIGLVAKAPSPIVFDEDDPDLSPLLSQLQNHLDSIKSNTDQLGGVEQEMARTKDILHNVLAQPAA